MYTSGCHARVSCKASFTSSWVEKKEVQDMSSYFGIIFSLCFFLGVISRPQGPDEDQGRVANIMSSLGHAVKSAVCIMIIQALHFMKLKQFSDAQGSNRVANQGPFRINDLVGHLNENRGPHYRVAIQ